INSRAYNPLSPIVNLLNLHKNGELTTEELNSKLAFWAKQDSRQNYLNEFYTRSWDQRYALQFNGGGDRNSYLVSGSYIHSLGNNYSENSKFNIRVNNDYKITDRFRFSTSAQFMREDHEFGRPSYGAFKPGGRLGDYLAFRDDEGNPLAI